MCVQWYLQYVVQESANGLMLLAHILPCWQDSKAFVFLLVMKQAGHVTLVFSVGIGDFMLVAFKAWFASLIGHR